MAIDRRALVDGIMGGLNVIGRSAVTPVHWAYDSTAAVPFAPDSARALLDAADWIDRNGDGVRENTRLDRVLREHDFGVALQFGNYRG